jgi:hypothetical protein
MNLPDPHDTPAPLETPEVPENTVLNAEFEAQKAAERAAAKAAFALPPTKPSTPWDGCIPPVF